MRLLLALTGPGRSSWLMCSGPGHPVLVRFAPYVAPSTHLESDSVPHPGQCRLHCHLHLRLPFAVSSPESLGSTPLIAAASLGAPSNSVSACQWPMKKRAEWSWAPFAGIRWCTERSVLQKVWWAAGRNYSFLGEPCHRALSWPPPLPLQGDPGASRPWLEAAASC